MRYTFRSYERDVAQIEALFEAYAQQQIEIDTDDIEETLQNWEQLIDALREEDDGDTADEIYEMLETIQERLDDYDQARPRQEAQVREAHANQRLTQSAAANLLDHQLKTKYQAPDIGREQQAHVHLRQVAPTLEERQRRLSDDT